MGVSLNQYSHNLSYKISSDVSVLYNLKINVIKINVIDKHQFICSFIFSEKIFARVYLNFELFLRKIPKIY